MSKVFKITIAIIIFLFSANMVLAADIDMNLTAEDTNSIEDANLIDTNTLDTNSIDDTNTVANETPTSPNDNVGGTVAPSGVSSIAQENMSFSNILNILVITVGVILILLAIAILVRLKG